MASVGLVDRLLEAAKRVPIDLGQGALHETTQGKRIALSLVPDGRGRHALDVGARLGKQTRWLEHRGYRVTPIDVDPKFGGCLPVDADEELPFDDGEFDLVWCSEVIEHLRDPARAVGELDRVLRPGGDLILTTPNSYALLFRILALLGLGPERLQRSDHKHFFDVEAVRRLVPGAALYGYFPYVLVKLTISRGVGALSPTFVVHRRKLA